MRKLLIISYDFPPSSRGIWRTLKFCRYMGEFGWKPSILTVRPVRTERFDLGPLRELPENTEVRRTESLDQNRLVYKLSNRNASIQQGPGKANPKPTHALFRGVMDVFRSWVLIPDDRVGWYPFAVHEGRKWLGEQRFDAVYTTSFPNTAHIVGERLARYAGLPLIADFRDIWIGNYSFYTPATPLHDRLHRRMERHVVQYASRIISATGPITTDFLKRYPAEPRGKFLTITNGFDPADFQETNPKPDHRHFTITYAGTMYGSTSPRAFLRAVRRLLRREPRWSAVLRLRFTGTMIEPYREMIRRFGLEEITRIDNYLAHDEALRVMAEADALLLIVSPVKGSHIMLTQKVFEYAAARRPIIGLVPRGAARDFLADLNEGPIAHPEDERKILRTLRGMLKKWEKEGRVKLPENPRLAAYHRRELTRRLCGVLDEAAARRLPNTADLNAEM